LPYQFQFFSLILKASHYEALVFHHHVIEFFFSCGTFPSAFSFAVHVEGLTSTNPTYISKLCDANFTKLCDGLISRLRLDEELAERHFFAPEHRPHLGCLNENVLRGKGEISEKMKSLSRYFRQVDLLMNLYNLFAF
jgi:hypothetical protein